MDKSSRVNPETIRTLLITAIAAAVITALALFYFGNSLSVLGSELLKRNIASIGLLARHHPELKDEIASSLAGRLGEADVKLGAEAAKEYGYAQDLPISAIPVLGDYYKGLLTSLALLLLLCFTVCAAIAFRSHRKLFGKVRDAAGAAEGIVEGNFGIRLEEREEGDFSKLGHQFNQMASRLEMSIGQLKNEKVFLKNIISDISHQLKTPLSSVKVFNEILSGDKAVNEEDRRRFLEKSAEQIERMEWLIQNLLLMAKLEAGSIVFTDEDKPLLPTIQGAVEALREKWEARGLEVSVSCPDGEGIRLLHDERWLEEAISNLVKNSIEHTSPGGHIEVELNASPIMTRVVVRDDGEGISSEDLPHIFERFYKGKNKLHGSGTGIGLALARSIIENEGGMINVQSAPGKGAVFTITFSNITKL